VEPKALREQQETEENKALEGRPDLTDLQVALE